MNLRLLLILILILIGIGGAVPRPDNPTFPERDAARQAACCARGLDCCQP